MVNGQKMSKSKGTFYTARQLFEQGHEPAAVRLELIKAHYRSNADFSMQGLKDSARMVEKWRKARLEIARRSPGWQARGSDPNALLALMNLRFAQFMENDLNIAGAIGALNADIDAALSRPFDPSRALPDDPKVIVQAMQADRKSSHPTRAIDIFERIDGVLGLLDLPRLESQSHGRAIYLPGVTPSDQVAALLDERANARAAKNFARSDEIRDQLKAMGYAIKDVAGGKVEVGPLG